MSNPWVKFYPSDWRADPALRMCSIAARGLWMEMLCVMHENGGDLAVNGKALTERQLANLAGCGADEVSILLSELDEAGVFSRRDDGTIYSRRMIRDAEKAEADKANGRKGGNPKIKPGVNPPVKGEDKAQKPEARSHIPEEIPPNPQGGGAGDLFEDLIGIFPVSPNTKRDRAFKAFSRRSASEQHDIIAAARKYRAWFDADCIRRGRSPEEAAGFVPPLDGWIINGTWKSVSGLSEAPKVEPMVKLDRVRHEALWLACERVQGKKAPTSDSTWSFRQSVVDEAKASLSHDMGGERVA